MTPHGDEVRAAVLAALLAGQSISEVAQQYNLPEGTVKGWKSRAKHATVTSDVTPKKEIGDLVMEYLRANLAALRAQAEVFSDPDYIRKQPASEAAVLHGVMTDKSIRLLEALSRHAADDSAAKG